MKCPACWCDKAYIRDTKGWKRMALACSGLMPMKCHHCYNKFVAFRLFTIGQRLHPPKLRIGRTLADDVEHDSIKMTSFAQAGGARTGSQQVRRAA